jgi:hypothetical protein
VIEVFGMTTPSRKCLIQGCRGEVPKGFGARDFCLDHYLGEVSQRLDVTTERFRRGQVVDDETIEWLLVESNFIVETIDNETLNLGANQRSKLLELLLDITNLNEYIRHFVAVARHAT